MPNRVLGTYKMLTKCLLKGQTNILRSHLPSTNLSLMTTALLWDSRGPLSFCIITHPMLLLNI